MCSGQVYFCLQPTCRCHRAEMCSKTAAFCSEYHVQFTFVIYTELTSVNSTLLWCRVVWMVTTLKEVRDILRFLLRFTVFKKCSIIFWPKPPRGAEHISAKGPPYLVQVMLRNPTYRQKIVGILIQNIKTSYFKLG